MLVRFRSEAYADIKMFGDIAVELLRMMGHSGTVPSAMMPEDIPAALERLDKALASREPDADQAKADLESEDEDEDEERRVSLKNRALPLISLFQAAAEKQVPVMWDA